MRWWLIAGAALYALLSPNQANSVIAPILPLILPTPTALEVAQEEWIDALAQCESSNNPNAVNQMDIDGTPSFGLLQFKKSTFAALSKEYDIGTDDYMDPVAQREIVRRMLADPYFTDAELRNRQFPGCIRNTVGLPPRK